MINFKYVVLNFKIIPENIIIEKISRFFKSCLRNFSVICYFCGKNRFD